MKIEFNTDKKIAHIINNSDKILSSYPYDSLLKKGYTNEEILNAFNFFNNKIKDFDAKNETEAFNIIAQYANDDENYNWKQIEIND